MTRLHWVRHGPTHARGMVGWSDLPADLSDSAAIAQLSDYLPGDAPVISSDLARAVTTADAIARDRPRLPHDPDLREINFGAWEMRHSDEIEDRDRLRAYWDTPGDIAPPAGESWNAVSARVSAAADRLVAAHPGRDVIVVAHFGAILTQVQRATGLTGYETFANRIDNLSVTEIVHRGGRWRLGAINHRP
ncbi:histidine phosphatase family protein [Roseovarius sp. SCSIO 43702]|uniref:histidine phosphatase family protein n=1 Tax=Roseovarius sp. SCSIO 43702 TaxID=2823043 RepID=UPI001C7351BE|nr:histidine phosphatase family protein [Roseovarius sp. SCSIO 43702]QYX57636.1 histidine phosphatase family protein [Roseovarius sp. SCSIO 43702]